MPKANILIADDETNIRLPCREILEEEGYCVFEATTGQETLAAISHNHIDLVLLDLKMPELNGIEVMKRMRAGDSATEVIIFSGQGTIKDAVTAIKLGAYDYIEKPLQPERLLVTVQNCLRQRMLAQENLALRSRLEENIDILGEDPRMKALYEKIQKVARASCYVMIYGESGSGKELVARNIHRQSNISDKPFVEVNCSAMPDDLIESELFGHVKGAFTNAIRDKKGKFEQADGGILFLDEIGDMSLKAQAKVLRALEDGEIQRVGSEEVTRVDLRVISATNKNLEKEIKRGNFREDLFYRLNVVSLHVPPLRDHKDDIPILVNSFLEYFCLKNNTTLKLLTPEAMDRLVDYHWPGNVRELKNLMEKLVVLSSSEIIEGWELDLLWEIEFNQTPKHSPIEKIQSLKQAKNKFEREFIANILRKNNGNISKTAQQLQINRSHLHEKILQLKIKV
jgi:two-component system nitrogen regulation response regulator NtrX